VYDVYLLFAGSSTILRRGSMHNVPKPAPPIRRTPSMPAGANAYLLHRSSSSHYAEPEYADPHALVPSYVGASSGGGYASGYAQSAYMVGGSGSGSGSGSPYHAGQNQSPYSSISFSDSSHSHSSPHHSSSQQYQQVCAPVASPIYMTPHLVPNVTPVQCVMPGSVAAPPPPPIPPPPEARHEKRPPGMPVTHSAPVLHQSHSQDDMDLPPPPPPEELEADIIYAKTMVNITPNGEPTNPSSNPGSERRKMGSVVETHAGIIANLNAKFAASPAPGPNSPPIMLGGKLPMPSGGGLAAAAVSPSSESDSTTPTAEDQQPPGMLGQIQRGTQLRRTLTNDRSAPKLQ
jgi:hypothetical protein